MSFWSRGYHDYGGWAPRKTAAQRRAEAARTLQAAAKRGTPMSPVVIAGRKIAHTFWGKAWCDNLERYRDFAYRLERGRSYVRSGSVLDLRIEAGKLVAKVSGSEVYDVEIEIDAVPAAAWRAIQRDCAGGIGSRLELLAGELSESVMARLCADRTGLFPPPPAIRFTCSCPDYAAMCKHVAAVMYGVGARLDASPELLFTLRRVSADELIASAVTAAPAQPASGRVLAAPAGLGALFGIELAEPAAPAPRSAAPVRASQPSKAKKASQPSKASQPKKATKLTKPSQPARPGKRSKATKLTKSTKPSQPRRRAR